MIESFEAESFGIRPPRLSRLWAAAIAILLLAEAAFGQAGHGAARIKGRVVDEKGLPVEGARIVFSYVGRAVGGIGRPRIEFREPAEFTTVSDSDGRWRLDYLAGGTWMVDVLVDGRRVARRSYYINEMGQNSVVLTRVVAHQDLPRDDPSAAFRIELPEKAVEAPVEGKLKSDFLDRANERFHLGKYDEAAAMYEEFLKVEPDALMLRLAIGDCHFLAGRLNRAISTYKDVAARASSDSRDAYLAGLAWAKIGEARAKMEDWDGARTSYEKAIAAFPYQETWAFNLGEILFARDGIDEALAAYGKARDLSPGWPDPILKIGYCWLKKGDRPRAVEAFKAFLKLEKGSKRAIEVQALIKNPGS